MIYKSLQIASIILGVIGTYMLVFGLHVKEGISRELRKDLYIDKSDLIAPADVRQRTMLIIYGLLFVTISAILQLLSILCF